MNVRHMSLAPALLGLVALLLVGCQSPTPMPATPVPTVPTPSPTRVALEPTVSRPATTSLSPTAVTPTVAPTVMAEPSATAAPTPLPEPTQVPEAAAGSRAVELGLERVAVFEAPLYVTHAGDGSGRLFVVEKDGLIRYLANGQGAPQPFLDIRDRVGNNASEQGLLGLAFAPDFASSGRLFVNYTVDSGDTVISRFALTSDKSRADPASETIVLRLDQPAGNHNGGDLVFGPDGYLYIGMGDGGGANDRYQNAQNPATLLGKMLRLDVSIDAWEPYAVPADNPWVTANWHGQDMRDEVWALGLRNPWRYSFDRETGDLWIGDVGQNQLEEIDFVPAGSSGGLNFGWPIMEGLSCLGGGTDCDRTGLELPVIDYEHAVGGCSVTGGYVYRGPTYKGLQGTYLYADYCSGKIWGLTRDGESWSSTLLGDSGFNISSLGEDEAGELYVTDLSGGGVYRITVARWGAIVPLVSDLSQ